MGSENIGGEKSKKSMGEITLTRKPTEVFFSHVLLPISIPVVMMFLGSRWLSHLGPPFYVIHGVLALGLAVSLAAIVTRIRQNDDISLFSRPLRIGIQEVSASLVVLVVSWSTIRLLAEGDLGLGSVREFAPFGYAATALVALLAYRLSTRTERSNLHSVIIIALALHLCWVFAAVTGLYPGGNSWWDVVGTVPLFEIRPDIDLALIGILWAALILSRRRSKLPLAWKIAALVLVAMGAFSSFLMENRAGLMSILLVTLIALASVHRRSQPTLLGRFVSSLFVVLWLGALIFSPGQFENLKVKEAADSLATHFIDGGQESRQSSTSGESSPAPGRASETELSRGTTDARLRTWQQLVSWSFENPIRAIGGSGFNSDVLSESGTRLFLLGSHDSEASNHPHNFLLTAQARLGLLGSIPLLLVSLSGFYLSLRNLFSGAESLMMMASLTFLALLPVALLGVVFETPFGGIPYWWAYGLLLSNTEKRRKVF